MNSPEKSALISSTFHIITKILKGMWKGMKMHENRNASNNHFQIKICIDMFYSFFFSCLIKRSSSSKFDHIDQLF